MESEVGETWQENTKEYFLREGLRPRRLNRKQRKIRWEDKDNPTEKHQLLLDLKSYFVLGYLLGFLPLQGLFHYNPSSLRFRWLSLHTMYTAVILTAFLLLTLERVNFMIASLSLGTLDYLSYTLAPSCLVWAFIRQAQKFPSLLKQWAKVDQSLQLINACPQLKLHLNIITAFYMSCFWGTIVCVQMISYKSLDSCPYDVITKLKATTGLFYGTMNKISTDPTISELPDSFIIQIYFNLIWLYSELTIVLLSYSLYQRFEMFNKYLDKLKHKDMPSVFWANMRFIYNSLSKLTRDVDGFLSLTTCVLFTISVIFTCLLLLESLSTPGNFMEIVALACVNILRLFMTSIIAANINEVGNDPLNVLFSVSTESFCEEVLRFQLEVIADNVALTGCNFFTITRSFILTIAGTIATYEVVLLQFGSQRHSSDVNTIHTCPINLTLATTVS